VGWNDHAAAGDFVADELRGEVFTLGDEVHFVGDDALAGGFELGHVLLSIPFVANRRHQISSLSSSALIPMSRRILRSRPRPMVLPLWTGTVVLRPSAWPKR